MALGPCASCRRHVREDERACPFCQVALTAVATTPDASQRLSRARLFAFATTITLSTVGCPDAKDPSRDPNTNIVQPYGAPPNPTPPDAASPAPTITTVPAPEPPPHGYDAGPYPSPTSTYDPNAQPGPAPLPTQPTAKPKPGPGGPVALYGAPPTPNEPMP